MKHTAKLLFALLFAVPIFSYPAAAQQAVAQATPVEIKLEAAKFDAYVGQYEDAVNLGGTVFSFFREGEKYFLRVTNQDKLELAASSEMILFVKENPGLTAEFVKDSNGCITGITWHPGGQIIFTKKITGRPTV